jgi:hypothetical protein
MRATLVVVLLLGMVDVGEAGFSGAQPNAGAMAVLLGFEALVAINRERTPREMPATSLAVSRTDGTHHQPFGAAHLSAGRLRLPQFAHLHDGVREDRRSFPASRCCRTGR